MIEPKLYYNDHSSEKPSPLDLGFIFGADGTNADYNFNIEKEVARKVVDLHTVSDSSTLVGAVVYDNDARVVIKTGDYRNKKSTIDAIDSLKRYRNGNNIQKALQVARDQLFTARKDAVKTLVLFTDKTSGLNEGAKEIAEQLKVAGVKIIAVTVGNETKNLDAISIPSEPKGLIQIADPKKDLDEAIARLGVTGKPGAFAFFVYISILALRFSLSFI